MPLASSRESVTERSDIEEHVRLTLNPEDHVVGNVVCATTHKKASVGRVCNRIATNLHTICLNLYSGVICIGERRSFNDHRASTVGRVVLCGLLHIKLIPVTTRDGNTWT